MRRLLIVLALLLAVAAPVRAQVVAQGAGGNSAWKVTFGGAAQPVTQGGAWSVTFASPQAVTQSGTWSVSFTAPQHVIVDSAPTTAVTGTFFQATQPVSNAGTFAVQVTSAPTTAVTGTFFQATQPVSNAGTFAVQVTSAPTTTVSGTVTAVQATGTNLHTVVDSAPTTAVTGPLTDAQLRAATVPVSGTVTANAGTNLNTSGLALEADGNLVRVADGIDSLNSAVINTTVVEKDFDTTGGVQNGATMGLLLPSASGPVLGGTLTNPVQVAVTSVPTTTVTATDLDIRNLTVGTDSVLVTQSDPFDVNVLAGTVNIGGGSVTAVQTTGTNLHTVVDSGTITTVSTVTAVTAISNALPAGSNLLGKVGIDQTTPGTTNRVDVGVFPDNEPFNLQQVAGTTAVTGGVAGILAVGGNVANAVTATANPVPVGGIFTTTPSTLTNGQTATLQFTNLQNVKVDCQSGCSAAPNQNIVTIGFNESVAAPLAATWYIRKQWALPAGAHAIPQRAFASVTTAASRTMIVVLNNLGNLNLSTNTFTAANSVASPYFYGRLFGCVTTVMSATLDTVTPTYTDDQGNSQAATGAAFAASDAVGECMEFPLAASVPGTALDTGVRAVTAATDSAAPTGVITFYGMNTLIDTVGPASTLDQAPSGFGELNANEQIAILEIQAATTAQQRSAGITISLR